MAWEEWREAEWSDGLDTWVMICNTRDLDNCLVKHGWKSTTTWHMGKANTV